jgi:hypothetical protein
MSQIPGFRIQISASTARKSIGACDVDDESFNLELVAHVIAGPVSEAVGIGLA